MFKSTNTALLLCMASFGSLSMASSQDSMPSPHFKQGLDAMFNKGAFWGKQVHLAWENNGDAYTILEPSPDGKALDIAAYDTATGKRTVVVSAAQLTPPGAASPMRIEDYGWSADGKKLLVFTNAEKVWRAYTRGDYWVYDTSSATPEGRLTKLGGDAPESTLMFATFSPDGKRVAYVRANNIYVEELASKKITQLTSDGSPDIINGTSDWVNEEELFLRNCMRWSPDSTKIAYWQFDQSGVGEYTLLNDTDQEYPVAFKYKYPQPGTTNAAVRAGIVSALGGQTIWVKLPGDPRQNYIAQMDWPGSSDVVVLEYLNRAQNDNQFLWANAKTGETRVVTEDTDKDWVDVFSMEWAEPFKASPNTGETNSTRAPIKDALFLSERDGWRHAYRVDLSSGQPHLVTNFPGDILDKSAVVSGASGMEQKEGWFYFLASPDDPVRQYLYRAPLDGSAAPQRITPADQPGVHNYDIAPNGKWAVHRYGAMDRPARTEIVSLPEHKLIRTLVDNNDLTARIQPYLSSNAEFFKVKVDNGATLDGFIIKPPNFDEKKKYPVITYVYGEPWIAVVRDDWEPFMRTLAGLMAEEGYLFVAIDNEGTPSPKGREWRKSVYRAVGVLSSAQQAQAIQALAGEHAYIDTTRMAIWGHSGGGSNTLDVMFRYPGVYSTGVALAPVADESHYDSIYQERYMGTPANNAKGYHDGSPINFASGLEGHLLVIHGSGDDNVHFQGTELLINKLVELGKPFDMMEYPNRTHALDEGPGTSVHLYSLVARYIEDHVQSGGVAQ